jgi:hypothetical protein
MNLTLPKNFSGFTRHFSSKNILRVAKKISWYLLILLFLATLGWLAYTWYFFIQTYAWTEDQKTTYRNEYIGETSFRQEKFNRTLDALQKRTEAHQGTSGFSKDLFTGN